MAIRMANMTGPRSEVPIYSLEEPGLFIVLREEHERRACFHATSSDVYTSHDVEWF
jgi:hypothetical protein